MKMKHSALGIVHCVLAALALALWCGGAFTAQRAQDALGAVSARWPAGGVSPAQLEAQMDIFRQDGSKDLPGLTLWAQHAAQSAADGEDRTAKAAVLELYGPAEFLRADRYLSGSAPARGNTKTCALSRGAAFDLWGGMGVTGRSLTWGEQEYTVQGVFEGEDSLIIVQAEPESKDLFPNMQLYFAKGGGRQAAEEFLARTDFGNPQLLDMPLLGWALGMLASLPGPLIGIWLLARLTVHGFRLRGQRRKLLYTLAPAILVVGADIFLLSRGGGVPAALIPSRWSDFDYWSALLDNLGDRVKAWLSMPQAGDISLLFSLLGAALLVSACLLVTAILLGMARVRKPLHALLACGGCVLLVFLMAAFYAGRGGLRVSPAMWLMPCLWIVTDLALFWWKEGAALETKT